MTNPSASSPASQACYTAIAFPLRLPLCNCIFILPLCLLSTSVPQVLQAHRQVGAAAASRRALGSICCLLSCTASVWVARAPMLPHPLINPSSKIVLLPRPMQAPPPWSARPSTSSWTCPSSARTCRYCNSTCAVPFWYHYSTVMPYCNTLHHHARRAAAHCFAPSAPPLRHPLPLLAPLLRPVPLSRAAVREGLLRSASGGQHHPLPIEPGTTSLTLHALTASPCASHVQAYIDATSTTGGWTSNCVQVPARPQRSAVQRSAAFCSSLLCLLNWVLRQVQLEPTYPT